MSSSGQKNEIQDPQVDQFTAANVADYLEAAAVAPELKAVQEKTEPVAMALVDPESVKEMDEMQQEFVRQRILFQLKAAKTAEAKVQILAKWTDKKGGDVILSTLLPIVGDASISFGSIAFLMQQAKEAGLSDEDKAKIKKQQIVSGVTEGVAGVTVPVLGKLILDYLLKPNTKALQTFNEHSAQLVIQAREAGVEESAIKSIERDAKRLSESMGEIRDFLPDFLKHN